MASIWLCAPGTGSPLKKLEGMLPNHHARARLSRWAEKLQAANSALVETVTKVNLDEVLMTLPTGHRMLLYIEWHSPPSALEKCQPRLTPKGGVLLTKDGTVHTLGMPPGKPEKANG